MVLAAILLAADPIEIGGEPLVLVPWREGEALIEYEIAQLQAAGADVVEVVLGFEAERLIPVVARDNVEPVVYARWREAPAGALRAGAAAVPRDTTAAIIARADEPRVAEVYRRLLDRHAVGSAEVTRPAFQGADGAPVIVGAATLAAVRNATDAAVVEAILRGPADRMAFDDDAVLLRVRDHADYRRARERMIGA